MDLNLEPRDSFLLATASGQLSFADAVETCKEVCDAAAAMKFGKILFDCLALEGELSPDNRIELGKTIAAHCRAFPRIPTVALVGKPPSITGLGAVVASNNGLPIETFRDLQGALDWLRSRP